MSVSNDKFLFECLEYEKKCVKQGQPVFDHRIDQDSIDRKDAEATLESLVTHYKKQLHLDMEKNFELTEENMADIVPAVVGMIYDLKELSDKLDENINPDDYTDESSSWCILDSLVGKHMSSFRNQLMNYLKWCFVQAKEEQKPSSHQKSSSGRGPRNQGRQNGRRGGGRFDNRGGRGGNGRGRGGKPGGRQFRNHNPEMEEKAISNVKESIDIMKQDTSMAELRLAPANSYHRRLQHQLITQEDLYSYSEGEGRDRAVVITRDPDKNSTPINPEKDRD